MIKIKFINQDETPLYKFDTVRLRCRSEIIIEVVDDPHYGRIFTFKEKYSRWLLDGRFISAYNRIYPPGDSNNIGWIVARGPNYVKVEEPQSMEDYIEL